MQPRVISTRLYIGSPLNQMRSKGSSRTRDPAADVPRRIISQADAPSRARKSLAIRSVISLLLSFNVPVISSLFLFRPLQSCILFYQQPPQELIFCLQTPRPCLQFL